MVQPSWLTLLPVQLRLKVLTCFSKVIGSQGIDMIEKELRNGLLPLKENDSVEDVRVLGAIGVVEMKEFIDVEKTQSRLIENGVWLRPFGKLLYTMPPFVSSGLDIHKITSAIHSSL